jgi:LmbE family N-acetylglucosaminyl deacetylase
MKNIIFISSHYDDIELSAGGVLSLLSKKYKIISIVTTKSNYTDYTGNILRTSKEALTEGEKALRFLGSSVNKNLNYDTKMVPFNAGCIEKINQYIDYYNPFMIFTHSLSSSHQDHINTSKSVMAAARRCKNVFLWENIYPDKMSNLPFRPQLYFNINKTFTKKIKSLQIHKSQFKKYPEWVDLVSSVNRLRGIENQCKYAEAFEIIKQEYPIE